MGVFILHVFIIVVQIVFFISSIKHKNKTNWNLLSSIQITSIIGSCIMMVYYNDLPGYGMQALTYLGEWFLCFCATIVYSVLFIISIITRFMIYLISKRKKK